MPSARCTFHPDRAGVAVCVGCRRVVCPDCSTVVDGLNCCVDCLEQRAASAAPTRREWTEGWTPRATGATLGWWGLLSLLAWAWYELQLVW